MLELYRNLTREQADICSLVLKSSGIYHYVKDELTGWTVWVRDEDASVAQSIMTDYFRENPRTEFSEIKETQKRSLAYSGIWIALVLLAFYVAAGEDRRFLHDAFGSSAEHILGGEIFRTVTSLMLHVDAVHLAGNMVSIALFGSVVCGLHGIGPGWLMILITGIIGNFSNALLYQTNHLSVGASTAVFGAIGLLSAYQFWKKLDPHGERVKAWLPLGGGLALLAFLGSGGGRVDVMAHLFGFSAGLLLETAYTLWIRKEISKAMQISCLVAAVVIPALSWIWPLRLGV